MRLLAARSGRELVTSDLARDAGVSRTTASRYLALLEALYLVHLQPAWATNATTRAKRAPTVHLVDSGLTASLLGLGERELASLDRDRELGFLLESFVVTELRKQAGWSDLSVDVLHFRDRNRPEVDIVIEQRATGAIAAVEVKSSIDAARRARSPSCAPARSPRDVVHGRRRAPPRQRRAPARRPVVGRAGPGVVDPVVNAAKRARSGDLQVAREDGNQNVGIDNDDLLRPYLVANRQRRNGRGSTSWRPVSSASRTISSSTALRRAVSVSR